MAERSWKAPIPTPEKTPLPTAQFETPEGWTDWLSRHHASSPGVWLRFAKKGAKHRTITYEQALDGALCYGWIDGQKKSDDENFWLQRFTLRGKKSIWSKINCRKALALIESGRMQAPGQQEIERAKADGRWDAAYDGQRTSETPSDLQEALDAHPQAKEFFLTLNSANRYAILFRVQTAKKAETRAKRIQQYVEMLERKETFHP